MSRGFCRLGVCVLLLVVCVVARAEDTIAALVPYLPLELVPVALVRPRLLPRPGITRLLVGWDVAPGTYLLTAVDGAAYFARRDQGGEVVENGLSASALSVTVEQDDWMLQFSGELAPA